MVSLGGRPHLLGTIPQWMGDSRDWKGTTLVVKTTNYQGSRDTLHLSERYTRLDDNTLDNRVTIDDPNTFTRS